MRDHRSAPGALRAVRVECRHTPRRFLVVRCVRLAIWRRPNPDLPTPAIEVVYYLRYDRRVKIGTSRNPGQRLARIRHHEVLAFERGGRALEQQRHRRFSDLREGGEWFTLTADLDEHISSLRARGAPWECYARWLADALR